MTIRTVPTVSAVRRTAAASGRYRYLHAGLHLLAVFWVVYSLFPAQGFTAAKISISGLLLAAVGCFALQVLSNLRVRQRSRFSPLTGALLALMFLWCGITILRGVTGDAGRLLTLLAHPEIGGLVWLLPFAVYVGTAGGGEVLRSLLPIFRLHSLIGVALTAWTMAEIISSGYAGTAWAKTIPTPGYALLYGAPVVLLLGVGGKKDRLIALTAQAMQIAVMFISVRRSGFAISLSVLMLGLMLGDARRVVGARLFAGLIALAIATAWFIGFVLTRLDQSWLVDTRSFIIEELSSDFSWQDWLFGRGALGTYYSPYFLELRLSGSAAGFWFNRQVVEIGYLHIVLKAGLIGAVLYFLIFAFSALRAMRLPENRLAYGLALFFAVHIAEMAMVGQASFLPERLMLWVLAGSVLASPHESRPSG